jgi:outer membrane usher protein
MNLVRDSAAGMTAQTVVTGLAGDADQASYALEAARDPGNTYSGSASGTYRTPYTSIHGAVGGGAHYYSGSVGLSGSLVAHPGGVTASPYAGNTVAVIAAPAAAGAVVSSYPGIKLDPLGYAVVPYLTPYRLNEITLDPKGIPDDVELQETSQRVAPRLGAVVMVKYATRSGRAALITSTLPDGQPMPFGATVFDASGNSVGTVTQGGRIYARISQAREQLTLKWGPEDANECVIDVVLPERAADTKTMAFEHLSAPCTSIKPSSKKPPTSPISPVAAR